MTGFLIIFVGVVYLITGFKFFIDGNIGMGIVFLGYAAANVGLYIGSK